MEWITIDGRNVNTRDELHEVLGKELSFPEWYGRNLDALYDCLTDVCDDTTLQVTHVDALREHLGGYADVFLRVLSEASEENPRLTVQTED